MCPHHGWRGGRPARRSMPHSFVMLVTGVSDGLVRIWFCWCRCHRIDTAVDALDSGATGTDFTKADAWVSGRALPAANMSESTLRSANADLAAATVNDTSFFCSCHPPLSRFRAPVQRVPQIIHVGSGVNLSCTSALSLLQLTCNGSTGQVPLPEHETF